MEELKSVFGEEALTYESFTQKVTDAGLKLGNLGSGNYVAKGKFDKLQTEFNQYKLDNDVSKYADYDSIKQELADLKAQQVESAQLGEVSKAGVDEKFAKFVMSEVRAMVDDKKDFATCLKEYLDANEQYKVAQSKSFFTKGNTSLNLQGKDGAKSVNQKMNEFLRSNK